MFAAISFILFKKSMFTVVLKMLVEISLLFMLFFNISSISICYSEAILKLAVSYEAYVGF